MNMRLSLRLGGILMTFQFSYILTLSYVRWNSNKGRRKYFYVYGYIWIFFLLFLQRETTFWLPGCFNGWGSLCKMEVNSKGKNLLPEQILSFKSWPHWEGRQKRQELFPLKVYLFTLMADQQKIYLSSKFERKMIHPCILKVRIQSMEGTQWRAWFGDTWWAISSGSTLSANSTIFAFHSSR